MKKFFKDFKEFALKGNIVDMAVGVVIGGAFGKIVTSLVTDIITPVISLLTGKVILTDLKWIISPAVVDKAGNIVKAEAALTYGNFLQSIIDFLIIALSIFLVIKLMMSATKKLEELKKAEEENPADTAPAETELSVLMEIRDQLNSNKKQVLINLNGSLQCEPFIFLHIR